MKVSINYTDFQNMFRQADRLNQFPTGLRDLFNYLEEYEEDTGENLEIDIIALCCEYTEANLSEVLKYYSLDSLDELRDSTQVIIVDDKSGEDPTIIYQNF